MRLKSYSCAPQPRFFVNELHHAYHCMKMVSRAALREISSHVQKVLWNGHRGGYSLTRQNRPHSVSPCPVINVVRRRYSIRCIRKRILGPSARAMVWVIPKAVKLQHSTNITRPQPRMQIGHHQLNVRRILLEMLANL